MSTVESNQHCTWNDKILKQGSPITTIYPLLLSFLPLPFIFETLPHKQLLNIVTLAPRTLF